MARIQRGPGEVISHRDSSCTGKIRYQSKHKAKAHKKHLHSVFGGKPIDLSAYRCAYCEGFHLGRNDGSRTLTDLDQFIEVA